MGKPGKPSLKGKLLFIRSSFIYRRPLHTFDEKDFKNILEIK